MSAYGAVPAPWALFPPNGLDRSPHVTVLVGLALSTFFAEAFGWTYGGLVVPGYLAMAYASSPVTAAVLTAEAVVTYALAFGVGRLLAKTGAWSTAFGRERFFLFLLCAVFVRLGAEGAIVPWLGARYRLPHERELYGIGLVLVPLVANVFWNEGLRYAAPRVAVVTGLTYLVLEHVLLRHTNYSLSRFLIANESGAEQFLNSPKAYVVLLVGALLAARSNVVNGWDFGGILVPALLAVAWYQPVKLVATLVEAVVVYWAASALSRVPPFARRLIEGPRKMLMAFSVGFALKMVIGFALARWSPHEQLVDYLGFGYVLPSLLAVKMWSRGGVGPILMPTLQTSAAALVAGNLVGYALARVGPAVGPAEVAHPPPAAAPRLEQHPVFELILGDTGPAPRGGEGGGESEAYRALRELVREVSEGRAAGGAARVSSLRLARGEAGGASWLTAVPDVFDPNEAPVGPRVALRLRPWPRGGWLVAVRAPASGSALTAAAFGVAEQLGASALVVVSRHPDVRRRDESFVGRLARQAELRTFWVEERGEGREAGLRLGHEVQEGFDALGLGRALGAELRLQWRPADEAGEASSDGAPRLELGRELSAEVGARVLGGVDEERWSGSLRRELGERMEALTTTPGGYAVPSVDELRLFGDVVAPAMLEPAGRPPSPWRRAVAARLGFRFARASDAGGEARVLYEPASEGRRGNPSWVAREAEALAGATELGVEVPAPRWEVGTATAGLALYDAFGGRHLLLAGALPSADPFGRSDPRRAEARGSFFQRIHELWLGAGAAAVAVRGADPARPIGDDVVVSFGREAEAGQSPEVFAGLMRAFEVAGLRVGLFDGAPERVPFGGRGEPTMAFADRFAPERFAIVWLGPGLRSHFARRDGATWFEATFAPTFAAPAELDVAARALALAECEGAACPRALAAPAARGGCDLDAVVQGLGLVSEQRNPFDRKALAERARSCHLEFALDAGSGALWALAVRRGQARLVPMPAPRAGRAALAATEAELRRGVALGAGEVRFERRAP